MGDTMAPAERGKAQMLLRATKGAFSLSAKAAVCVFRFSKKTCQTIRNNVYIDQQRVEYIMYLMKRTGSYVRDEVLLDLKPYLNSQNVNVALEEVHNQALRETYRYCHIDRELLKYICHLSADDLNAFNIRQKDIRRCMHHMDIIGDVLWTLLQERPYLYSDSFSHSQPLSDDLKMMRKWNNRVDEQELIKKIGSQDSWSIFNHEDLPYDEADLGENLINRDTYLESECINSEDSDGDNDVHETNAKFSATAYFKNEWKEQEELTSPMKRSEKKPKQKKHGLLNPIKKLLRLSKSEKNVPGDAERNKLLDTQNKIKERKLSKVIDDFEATNDDWKNQATNRLDLEQGSRYSNRHDTKGQGQELCVPDYQARRKNASGDRDEGLVIQVPMNVKKIVLVKDGRKITIEV